MVTTSFDDYDTKNIIYEQNVNNRHSWDMILIGKNLSIRRSLWKKTVMVFAVSIPKFNKSASFCWRNTAVSYYRHTSVQKCLCTDTRSWFCDSWNRRTVFAAKIWLLLVLSDLWLWKLLAFLTFYSCSFCFYSYSEIWWTSSCYLWGIDMSKKEKLISLVVFGLPCSSGNCHRLSEIPWEHQTY